MTASRYWSLFFELYESLPRQGPGNHSCTARALALCGSLPSGASILDAGCGAGLQTLSLASLTTGHILAIDTHAPLIDELRQRISKHSRENRITAKIADMAAPPVEPGSLDLIWSEGALYFLGIAEGLRLYRPLLRPGGCIAFTEAVWLRSDPPAEIRDHWKNEYPQMRDTAANLRIAADCGYEVLGHFTLPDSAWRDDFYTPMEQRLADMRLKYANDPEALPILLELGKEPALHRHYSAYYGYEFIVLRRTS